jgi:hypothetical protein
MEGEKIMQRQWQGGWIAYLEILDRLELRRDVMESGA